MHVCVPLDCLSPLCLTLSLPLMHSIVTSRRVRAVRSQVRHAHAVADDVLLDDLRRVGRNKVLQSVQGHLSVRCSTFTSTHALTLHLNDLISDHTGCKVVVAVHSLAKRCSPRGFGVWRLNLKRAVYICFSHFCITPKELPTSLTHTLASTSTLTHTHTHTHTHTRTHTYTHTHTLHIHSHTHKHTHRQMHTSDDLLTALPFL
jgi:hypothetical protein